MKRLAPWLAVVLALVGYFVFRSDSQPDSTAPSHQPAQPQLEPPPQKDSSPRIELEDRVEAATAQAWVSGRVVDGAAVPIVGCVITAQAMEPELSVDSPRPDSAPSWQITTDAQGRFELCLPPFLELAVSLSHRDFPQQVAALGLVLGRAERRDLGDQVLHSQPGLAVVAVDATTGQAIGQAHFELTPRWTDALLPGHPASAARRLATSGPDGRATLHGVAPGSYQLRAHASSYASAEVAHDHLDRAGLECVVRLQPGVTRRGTVSDAAGRPLVASIAATPIEADGPVISAWSNEQGEFRLFGLRIQRYRLEVQAAQAGSLTVADVPMTQGAEPIEIRYPRGAILSGRVRSVDGRPVRATVQAMASTPRQPEQCLARCVSQANGEFELIGLNRQPHWLEVEADGIPSQRFGPFLPDQPGLDLPLQEGATLRGRVVDTTGRAVARAKVDWIDASHDGSSQAEFLRRLPGMQRIRTTMTDAQGGFELTGLPQGECRVRVTAAGHPVIASAPIHVTLGSYHDLGSLALVLGGRIRGRVLDSAGHPVPSHAIAAEPTPGPTFRAAATISSDAQGNFELGPLAPGDYVVSSVPVRDPQGKLTAIRPATVRSVTVEAGQVHDLELRLRTP